MPPFELTDGVKSCIDMAEAALGVKNIALDTLSNENDTLKKENLQLVDLATAKGGDQVPLLVQRLAQARLEAQHAQLESAALRCRLQEETEVRQDLERELEDTAAAAQELWESMQAVYSEAADSRAPSRADSDDGWGTPPGASSPTSSTAAATPLQQQQQRPQTPLQQGIAAAAAAALAAAAAAAAAVEQQQGGAGGSRPTTPVRLSLLGTPAGADAAAAGDDEGVLAEGIANAVTAAAGAAVGLNVPLTGILTPLEDKLQSLSSKLVGLVSWLDARDAASPGSTPRSSSTAAATRYSTPRLGTAAASPAGAAAAAGGSGGMRLGLLPLGSPVMGSGDVYSVAAALDAAAGLDSPGSSVKAGDAAAMAKRRPSPRVGLAASLVAAAAAAAGGADVDVAARNGTAAAGNDTGANRAADVCRVKDS